MNLTSVVFLVLLCFWSEKAAALLPSNARVMKREVSSCSMMAPVDFKKSVVAATLISSLVIQPMYAANAANDALVAAQRAMMTEKEKPQDNRSFKELPFAAQKRRAMEMCKEKKNLRAAGYKDEKSCKADALAGNFGLIVQAATGDSGFRSSGTSAKDLMNKAQ